MGVFLFSVIIKKQMNYFKVSKFFLFASVFFIALVSGSTLFPFIVGKYAWFRTSVDLALIFFLLGLLFYQYKSAEISINQRLSQILKSPLVIAVTIFVAIFLIACFFGVDPETSFWSNFERGEGGLQILHLYIFFLLLLILFREDSDWYKLFTFSLLAGLLMVLYGIGASLKYADAEITIRYDPEGAMEQILTGRGGPLYQTFKTFIGSRFNEPGFRLSGSIGNPAYVSAYAIFMLFYASYLLIAKYKNRYRSWGAIFLYLTIAIFISAFILSATRGAFIGLIAAIIAFAAFYIYSHRTARKWVVGGLLSLILIIGALVYFQNTPFVKAIPGSRIFDISFATKTFQDRMTMWKAAIDGFKERPILGWGPENFLRVFAHNFNPAYFDPAKGFGAWFDRAHSIYFDYLAETGMSGFLSYFGIFAVFYWQLLKKTRINTDEKRIDVDKNRNRNIRINQPDQYKSVFANALLFSLPVAYLVQGAVLFDVLPIYYNNFLFLAFAGYKLSKQELVNSN